MSGSRAGGDTSIIVLAQRPPAIPEVGLRLPPGRARFEKVEVRTIIPGYRSVMPQFADAPVVREYASLFGGTARLRAARVHGLDMLVLDAPHLYDRDGGPYADRRGQDPRPHGEPCCLAVDCPPKLEHG